MAYARARDAADAFAAVVGRDETLLDRAWLEPAGPLAKKAIQERDRASLALSEQLDARDRAISDLTVVLYGRSKAGKSCSLSSALTGGGFDGIGDGGRNFTRARREAGSGGVRVVDSPGIQAVGSAELEVETRRAVHEADLLIVQLTDDAIFREDFERSEELESHRAPWSLASM